MKLADPEAGYEDRASPLRHTASLLSPSLTGGLQAVRRHLSVSNPPDGTSNAFPMDPTSTGASGMLQIPHLFWNHLTTTTATNGMSIDNPDPLSDNMAWDDMFNFGSTTVDARMVIGDTWGPQTSVISGGGSGLSVAQAPLPWSVPIATGYSDQPASFAQSTGPSVEYRPDQAAVSSAIMNYIADMSRTNT
jgi:hypothetical protein